MGNDLFKTYSATIDYKNDIILCNAIQIPIHHVSQSATQLPILSDTITQITVPPRCEYITRINILNPPADRTGILPKIEISEGLFLCESLVSVDSNNQALTSIMNTTEKDVMISNLEFHLEPFEYSNDAHNNADILTITNAPSNYGSDRLLLPRLGSSQKIFGIWAKEMAIGNRLSET